MCDPGAPGAGGCPKEALMAAFSDATAYFHSALHSIDHNPLYQTIAGDQIAEEFFAEFGPLMYVTLMPLLFVFLRTIVYPACDGGMLVVAAWPPPPPGVSRSRGYRQLRRALLAVKGNMCMALSPGKIQFSPDTKMADQAEAAKFIAGGLP